MECNASPRIRVDGAEIGGYVDIRHTGKSARDEAKATNKGCYKNYKCLTCYTSTRTSRWPVTEAGDKEGILQKLQVFDLLYLNNLNISCFLHMTILLLSQVYKEGSVLLPHVDDVPLICSAIINVAQSVEEPWPLEVYGRDGMAVNITMSPGDIVLYESHSLIHGRPFPLVGEYYANVFIHFEPHEEENAVFPPPYFVPGTPKELIDSYYTQGRLRGDKGEVAREDEDEDESTPAHLAAATGDVRSLKELAIMNKEYLTARDANGWMPIHEASRGGHREAVELLLSYGADVNAVSSHEQGSTPLRLATEEHGNDHPLVEYLLSLDAIDSGPDL